MNWEIAGHRVNLYGVIYGKDGDYVKLNRTVWFFMYDESDGYRSYCEGITAITENEAKELGIGPFFSTPIATVKVEVYDENDTDGTQLIDVEDGHIWLNVGTANKDDYYPWYFFNWHPKLTWQNPKEEDPK